MILTNDNPRGERPANIIADIVAGYPDEILQLNAAQEYPPGFLQDPGRIPIEALEFSWHFCYEYVLGPFYQTAFMARLVSQATTSNPRSSAFLAPDWSPLARHPLLRDCSFLVLSSVIREWGYGVRTVFHAYLL